MTGISLESLSASSEKGHTKTAEDNDRDSSCEDSPDLELQEVVGEYALGGVTWYYARLRTEVIQKVCCGDNNPARVT